MAEEKKIEVTEKELVTLLKETSEAAAKSAIDARALELGLGAKKFAGYRGAVSDKSAEEFAAMEKKEQWAGFIKAVYHQDKQALAMYKGMNETTGSAGGFVVPEEFAAEVNRIVEDFGLVPKLARKFPMAHDVLNVPRLSATVSVYWPGEASAGTAAQPTFERVVLTAKTLIGITPMSNELLADANISVIDLLVELFAEAIAGEMDNQGFTGSGSPFTGIFTDAGVTKYYLGGTSTGGIASTAEITLDDCRNMISKIKPWALQGAAFIMHRTVWAHLQTVKAATTGDYMISAYNPVVVGANTIQGFPNASAGVLWGYPVYLSDKLPVLNSSDTVDTPFAIFGNLKHLYVGMRQEMGVAISDSATIGSDNLFAQNMSAVRVVTRTAISVGLPAAFCVAVCDAS